MGVGDHLGEQWGWSQIDLDPSPAGGWTVWTVAETGSTNTDLIAAAAAGIADRTVLTTAHQTAGRGRLDRSWEAPPGRNLLASILFRQVPEVAGDLTRAVGVAAVSAVSEIAGCAPDAVRLKWPNDVLLDGRKLAGILAQRAGDGPVVVGIGLNVGWAPDGAAALGDGHGVEHVLSALLGSLDGALDPGFDLHPRYRDLLDTIGRRIRIELPAAHGVANLVGRAVDVEPDGRLVVLDECAITHRVDAGDVVHLRPAEPG